MMTVATVGLLTAMAPSLKANLVLDLSSAKYISGTSSPTENQICYALGISSTQIGSLLCQFGSQGAIGGTLDNSYTCKSGLTTVDYVGGNCASATCLILKNGNSGCYVWNICNWNGTDQIDCNVKGHPTECDFYGCCQSPPPPKITSVPEPSTIVAGALLLLPFGVSTVRILRRHKAE